MIDQIQFGRVLLLLHFVVLGALASRAMFSRGMQMFCIPNLTPESLSRFQLTFLRGVVFKQRNTDKCSQRCQWPVCCLHRAQQCRHTPVQFPVSMQCHQFGRIWLFKSARNACFIIFWIQVKSCHLLLVLATYIYSLTHSLDTNTSFFFTKLLL